MLRAGEGANAGSGLVQCVPWWSSSNSGPGPRLPPTPWGRVGMAGGRGRRTTSRAASSSLSAFTRGGGLVLAAVSRYTCRKVAPTPATSARASRRHSSSAHNGTSSLSARSSRREAGLECVSLVLVVAERYTRREASPTQAASARASRHRSTSARDGTLSRSARNSRREAGPKRGGPGVRRRPDSRCPARRTLLGIRY